MPTRDEADAQEASARAFDQIGVQEAQIRSAESLDELVVTLKRIANVAEHRHYGITTKEVSDAIELLHSQNAERLAEEEQARSEPDTWVNEQRTILVHLWDNGRMTFAERDHPDEVWRPPVVLERERR